jgi:phosphoglycolate phosphatase-like HAD superfamily hydrolase
VVAVGVATGATPPAELAAAGAHHVLDDLGDIDQVVELLAG